MAQQLQGDALHNELLSNQSKRKFEGGEDAPTGKRISGAGVDTVFRLLVPERKVGSLIGKGGAIVKQIRDDTHARIRVIDGVPNCEERVAIIYARDNPNEHPHNAAQRALFALHARLIEGEEPQQNLGPGIPPGIPTRLLVCHSQAGSLIGRQGTIIREMRESTNTHIKILPAEDLPSCGLANDRVVQLVGTPESLLQALEQVSKQLRENPPRERPGGAPPSLKAALAGGSAAPAAAAPTGYAFQPTQGVPAASPGQAGQQAVYPPPPKGAMAPGGYF